MRCVIDIEANSLNNPTKIWLVVCKDIDNDQLHIFRNLTTDDSERHRLLAFAGTVDLWIGHNLLGYDLPVLRNLIDYEYKGSVVDTLIVSKLVDYSREQGHSIEDYGLEFGLEKIKFNDFTQWSQELEDYCIRDVDICHRIFSRFHRVINSPDWKPALDLEHSFQLVVNSLHDNGFAFNRKRAESLLESVTEQLKVLDEKILNEFPPKQVVERYFTPKLTKHGTISRTSVPRSLHVHISDFEPGREYPLYRTVEFNPASHKQVIAVLNDAGWSPIDRTTTHIETERDLQRSKWKRDQSTDVDALRLKLKELQKTGWKINETNLATLPEDAPAPARTLAKRILLEARRRTLTEWLGLVQDDDRIHGTYYGIGAWTHRMAHQRPNTANIPTDAKLYGGEMRSLWRAPRNRLLVGVDAESIQLRVFAHYVEDEELIHAIVTGTKTDKTDPHSHNQRILGSVCKSRQAAKRFLYALFLGAGLGKLAQILECSDHEAEEALDRLMAQYQGWVRLKEKNIPQDAKRGWFLGLDGRKVALPGATTGERKHLAMSGYLQNGEAIIMKKACLLWHKEIENDAELRSLLGKRSSVSDPASTSDKSPLRYGFLDGDGPIGSGVVKIVNFVHDEWQTETPNRMEVALRVAAIQADSLRKVGEELKLKCPLAGSYWNEDHKDYTIGPHWGVTH